MFFNIFDIKLLLTCIMDTFATICTKPAPNSSYLVILTSSVVSIILSHLSSLSLNRFKTALDPLGTALKADGSGLKRLRAQYYTSYTTTELRKQVNNSKRNFRTSILKLREYLEDDTL